MGKDDIIKDFKNRQFTFAAYNQRLINLLTDLLKKEGIVIHQITGRTKDLDSLSKKIDKKSGKYVAVEDITDIVGLRVITYLENEVDTVAEIIRREFKVDEVNSIDKRVLKIDQFGYRSLHIVISLNNKRDSLPEYTEYATIKCEVQIRSILQHAWAEIEHDLGYKGKNAPDEFKRAFNRLAALLESADIEFVNLKNSLNKYEKDITTLIKNEPESVDINKASLSSFIENNSIIKDAIKIIEKSPGKTDNYLDLDWLGSLLNYFEIKSIKDLDEMLILNKNRYLKFVVNFLDDSSFEGPISKSVSIMYFTHFLAASTESVDSITKYLQQNKFTESDESLAESYIKFYRESK